MQYFDLHDEFVVRLNIFPLSRLKNSGFVSSCLNRQSLHGLMPRKIHQSKQITLFLEECLKILHDIQSKLGPHLEIFSTVLSEF